MEIHKFICDCCGKELDNKKVTISQNYEGQRYDVLEEEYEHYRVSETYHLCTDCWRNVKNLVIKLSNYGK